MTRLFSGTASVVNGSAVVTITSGDPLNNANCPIDAQVSINGALYFVLTRDSTTQFTVTQNYAGATATVPVTIDPLTPDALSVVNVAILAAKVQAQLNVLDKNSQGLFYTRLGVTGDSDPGPGYIAFDDADPTAVTEFYIDLVDGNDRSVDGLLGQWAVGTILVIRSLTTTAYVALEMAVNVSDETGYFKGEVRYIDHDGVIADGEQVSIGWFRIGSGLAFDQSGSFAGRDAYDAEAGGFVYLSNDGDGDTLTGGVLFVKASGTSGDWGPGIPLEGAKGDKGWAPKFAVVTDGARRVLQLAGYVGGAGTEPTANVGEYVGATGYTSVLASGVDVRGAIGATGAAGTNGTNGTNGADGADGADGTDPGILLIWDEDNADSNQGSGKIWADNDTLGSATTIYISKTNRAGDDISGFLATLADSSNPTRKGLVTLTRSGGNAQAVFDLTALTDATGYVKLTVANPAGATGFSNNDLISFQFAVAGDQGASGAGTGDFNGPASAVDDNFVSFDGTGGKTGQDSGVSAATFARVANNLSDLASKQAAFDNLHLQGADIASNTTINLDTATGSFVDVTGTTNTTAITLSDGRRRRVRAAGAWPITVSANLVLNNGGSNYTCTAGDIIDFVADGTVVRGTVHPISGIMPGAAAAATTYTKAQTDDLVNAARASARVRVAATGNVTIATGLNNGDTLDGVTLSTGDEVLLPAQSAPAENGIYVVGASPARSAAFSTYDSMPGVYVSVMEGTANADTLWRCTSNKGGTLNTTALVFEKFTSGAGGLTNLLINGNGAINQRGATSQADDTYAWDRHYVLTQTAAIGVSTISDVADGLPSMMRLTQSQASAQRMGVAQIIEAKNCKDLRGQAVTLIGKLRCSSAQGIRYAILEWTGTADTVTSDVVNSWTNATFTAGQFFNSTTLTVTQVGTITPSAATVTDFTLTTTLGSSVNNVIVMIWTEGTAAQNVTLDVAWEFVKGTLTGQIYPVAPRHIQQEDLLCKRYFEYVGLINGLTGCYASGFAIGATRTWSAVKRVTPTCSVSGVVATILTGVSFNTVYRDAASYALVFNTSSPVGTLGIIAYVITADAEL